MLLIHQAGVVKVGEVVRYTLTYTPSADRILPSPSQLHVRIKNTSAIPYRAAYLHGPYTLHVSTYPSTFNPNHKLERPRRDGIPEFESNLKAGGHFHSTLVVPEDIREHGEKRSLSNAEKGTPESVTWIIEIASQILFSNSASVHYEIMVGRDERSLDLGFAAIAAKGHGGPGHLTDHASSPAKTIDNTKTPTKGVYSTAVSLVVEDTSTLWNKPALPSWDDVTSESSHENGQAKSDTKIKRMSGMSTSEDVEDRPQKKIHLVVLTHGLHSNIGADMLYMKESIDATARESRERQRAKKNKTSAQKNDSDEPSSTAPLSGGQEDMENGQQVGAEGDDDDDDEQVIVRGFTGNTTRTERGIQYLGKRLAKYILSMTYPDQPFLPISKKSFARTVTGSFGVSKSSKEPGVPAHQGSSIHRTDNKPKRRPYRYTSISFIGHSLGGLIQIYAVAYIQKHSPGFFDIVKPVNFIAMASPMLGLSNENPMYVKFALDFGLVGRTGQDLGLTWRAPTLARNGWSSMLSSFGAGGNSQQQPKEKDPRAKPLLRILPTGPAHQVLKQFRNRTVYSNVVNDGIVPLRTSCLLFLDWRGLGRVENARRENGLLATLASTGWAELTGANSVSHRPMSSTETDEDFLSDGTSREARQPSSEEEKKEEDKLDVPASQALSSTSAPTSPSPNQFLDPRRAAATSPQPSGSGSSGTSDSRQSSTQSPLDHFFSFFKNAPAEPSRRRKLSNKAQRTYRRAQIIRKDSSNREEHSAPPAVSSVPSQDRTQQDVRRAESFEGGPPPKTSVFDAAADILSPPIPPLSWLTDPTSRDRTIFHDRVYHPEDIPPPPTRRPRLGKSFSADSLRRASSSSINSQQTQGSTDGDSGTMRVEEKIARAYHHHLSWRKVLVRLEPDAHNNMIVRRMFANAYGWDVIKHLCDTHFSDSFSSKTRDDMEANVERALPAETPASHDANQVAGQTSAQDPNANRPRTTSELREVEDEVRALPGTMGSMSSKRTMSSSSSWSRRGSGAWDEHIFEGDETGDESDAGGEDSSSASHGPFEALQRFWRGEPSSPKKQQQQQQQPAPRITTSNLVTSPSATVTVSPAAISPGPADGSAASPGRRHDTSELGLRTGGTSSHQSDIAEHMARAAADH